MQDANEDVALEACEFWPALAQTRLCKEVLRPVLPELVHLLLDKMVYSDEEIADEGEDETVPDDPKDIRPFLTGSKTRGAGDDDDSDDDGDGDLSEWTLRKCSASSLDVLSTVFRFVT